MLQRLDFDRLANEYGLEIEKHDYGRAKQWKDAEVLLFLPKHIGIDALVWGVFPPAGALQCCENIIVHSNLHEDTDGVLRWHKLEYLANDVFNEHYLRNVIEQVLKVIPKLPR